jgi:hypothetical protein
MSRRPLTTSEDFSEAKQDFDQIPAVPVSEASSYLACRNPTLAKCGGEAQHLEKLEVWSPPGLPNV